MDVDRDAYEEGKAAMSLFRSILLGVGLVSTSVMLVPPLGAAIAQSGTETISYDGVRDVGGTLVRYHAVTINYDNKTITYHYNDGTRFTEVFTDSAWFSYFVNMFKQQQNVGQD